MFLEEHHINLPQLGESKFSQYRPLLNVSKIPIEQRREYITIYNNVTDSTDGVIRSGSSFVVKNQSRVAQQSLQSRQSNTCNLAHSAAECGLLRRRWVKYRVLSEKRLHKLWMMRVFALPHNERHVMDWVSQR